MTKSNCFSRAKRLVCAGYKAAKEEKRRRTRAERRSAKVCLRNDPDHAPSTQLVRLDGWNVA